MVHQKTSRRSSVATQIGIFAALLTILMVTSGIIIGILAKVYFRAPETTEETEIPESIEEPTAPDIPVIDFQPIIDQWATNASGNRSVLIYDLENDKIVGEYNAEANYGTASLYKLFVVYEGYRRLENGEWQASDPAGVTGYTILECLDLAIRESHSPCAETLWSLIGATELDQIIIDDFKITGSSISRLTSNPRDILAIMKLFYKHPDIKNPTYISRLKDSFLNQPATTYNWRQGLPSGFTEAKVYDKVGWEYNPAGYWNIYHDAAIVEFPEQDRHYIVIVMTNYVPFKHIKEFGTIFEETFLSKY